MTLWNYHAAAVTGASSGLGAEFARQLAQKGSDLILIARRRDRLETLASELERLGRRVEVVVADLEDRQERDRVGRLLVERGIDLLINNAGYGKLGSFAEQPLDVVTGQVELNVQALVELSHHALRAFSNKQTPTGLINVASVAGFSPLPRFAIYAATKAFVRDFSHSLAWECRGTLTSVTVLCPGPTESEFFEKAGSPAFSMKMMTASDVVAQALSGFAAGQVEVVPGPMNKLMRFVAKLTPRALGVPGAGLVMRARQGS